MMAVPVGIIATIFPGMYLAHDERGYTAQYRKHSNTSYHTAGYGDRLNLLIDDIFTCQLIENSSGCQSQAYYYHPAPTGY